MVGYHTATHQRIMDLGFREFKGFEVYQCYMKRISRNIIDDLTRARS